MTDRLLFQTEKVSEQTVGSDETAGGTVSDR